MSSSHKWENHENNNDFIARLAEKLMHDTLNIGKTGALPVTGTNFLAVAVGSNPTWSKRLCHDRKAMRLVSTARFFKTLNATPFVLVVSMLPRMGREVGSTPTRSKLASMCSAWHRASVESVRSAVKETDTDYVPLDNERDWGSIPHWFQMHVFIAGLAQRIFAFFVRRITGV